MSTFPPDLIFLDRGWLSSNSLLMLGDAPTIVDTGHVSQQRQLEALIKHHLPQAPLHQIINTHLHSDHCGGNAHLKKIHAAAKILIPSTQWGEVEEWAFLKETHENIGQSCPPFKADEQLRPNTEKTINDRVWQIHAAPGHDMDAIVLFAPKEKILISGDAFWENGFGVVFPELEGQMGFPFIAQTLAMIEALQPAWVVPGHGNIFSQVHTSLDKAKSKLEYFQNQPLSHAAYAANVLIKFKLMHEQEMQHEALQAWLSKAPTLINIRDRFFQDLSLDAWLDQILSTLTTKKSIAIQGTTLINL